MIGWGDVYNVVVAVVPLYFALLLGYGSVRWWRMFAGEQLEAVNRLVAYFALPFFAFEFTIHADPFTMNYRTIAADALAKLLVIAVAAAWAGLRRRSKGGGCCWSITSFSLSSLTNSLVVGIPVAKAMYGDWAVDIIVQISVVQAIVWLTLLLFALEFRRAVSGLDVVSVGDGAVKDVEAGGHPLTTPASLLSLVKTVGYKIAVNPNSYASFVGIAWAFISNRWHLGLPRVVEGSVSIMSKGGTGLAMFSMGLFMAKQEKIIACGPSKGALAMALKFLAGPAAMAAASVALGLRGDLLRVAIIQAAVPQSITSFIFAKEYGLHADVLSTAVIFGMLVSLPVLIAYYFVLGFLRL